MSLKPPLDFYMTIFLQPVTQLSLVNVYRWAALVIQCCCSFENTS